MVLFVHVLLKSDIWRSCRTPNIRFTKYQYQVPIPSTKFTMAYMETYPGLIGRFLPDLLLLSKVDKSYQLSAWNMLQEEYKLYRHFFLQLFRIFHIHSKFLVTDCTTCFDRSYAARMIPDGLKASHFNILINIRLSRCLGMLPTCFGTLAVLLEV